MEIRIYPNSSRPGVGQKPRREAQRPHIPQHGRHCPVLEAGSSAGFLVFPPLEPHEGYHIEYQGEGRYLFRYFMRMAGGKWDTVFTLEMTMPLGSPVGSVAMIKQDVKFLVPNSPIDREGALRIAQTFFVLENTGTPAGSVSLRGATNFHTPPGWDTLYTPIFNMIERPVAPMLTVRVETDWYPHETEFRYVLQPGEGIPGAHTLPIGQVMFLPREEITLRELTAKEMEGIRKAREEFSRDKSTVSATTRYGMQYSPHYSQQSREHRFDGQESKE